MAEVPIADIPRHTSGIELIGRYQGSGLRKTPYLVRRSDGQVIQLSAVLFATLQAADGRRDAHAIAAHVAARIKRRVSAENVQFFIDQKLRPLGVLAQADGTTGEFVKRPPLLALRHRKPILKERAVNAVASVFQAFYLPPFVVGILVALVLFDAWLFLQHGIAAGLVSAIYDPEKMLGVFVAVVAATAFHEIGHAAACRYSGARPGVMGAAIYLVWPAFYCDVTDAYRLSRGGRLRTDLGGVYFNAIFALLCGGAYALTGEEAWLFIASIQHLVIVQQLLPLLRFDGYYVLSDLTGVPDILSRIGPILRSLVPFRKPDPRVAELKPWVRAVVTGYVLLMIPMLALLILWLVVAVPRLVATIVDSLGRHLDHIGTAFGGGELALGVVLVLKVLFLLLPLAAMALSLGRLSKRAARPLAGWAAESPTRKSILAMTVAVLGTFLFATWWPNGDYRPISPHERGTLGEGLESLKTAPAQAAAVPPALLSGDPVPDVGEIRRDGEAPASQDVPGEPRRASGGEPVRSGSEPLGGETPVSGESPTGTDTTTTPTGTTTAPTSTTTTSPPPTTTTTTDPGTTSAPTSDGTTTTAAPAPTDSGSTTTTSEPAPTTTTAEPTTTTTTAEPAPTSTTETVTSTVPDAATTTSTVPMTDPTTTTTTTTTP